MSNLFFFVYKLVIVIGYQIGIDYLLIFTFYLMIYIIHITFVSVLSVIRFFEANFKNRSLALHNFLPPLLASTFQLSLITH